jgi:hypothetical protein
LAFDLSSMFFEFILFVVAISWRTIFTKTLLLFHWHFASIDKNSLASLSLTFLYFFFPPIVVQEVKYLFLIFVPLMFFLNFLHSLFLFLFVVVSPFVILLFSFVCLFSRYYKWCFGFKFNIKSLHFHFMVSFDIVFLLFKKIPFVVFFKLQITLVHIDFLFLDYFHYPKLLVLNFANKWR